MATSAYHTPSSPRRRRPDPARVVQSYQHQVEALGKRGAFRRTAALYGISDETVRRYVLATQQPKTPAPKVDAVPPYEPPPGGYPEPQPPRHDINLPHTAPQRAAVATCGNAAGGDPLPAPLERVIMSNVKRGLHATEYATRHTPERGDEAEETPHTPQPEREPEDEAPDEIPLPPAGPVGPLPAPPPPPPPPQPVAWAATPTPYPQPEPEPHPDPMPEPDPRPEPSPDPIPWPPTPGPNPRAIVVRQVVRVPDRARNAGLLGWLAEHEAARKQLLGLAVLLVLIGLSWLG
jgi:hypothetical protein